jgi:hypothetical protein
MFSLNYSSRNNEKFRGGSRGWVIRHNGGNLKWSCWNVFHIGDKVVGAVEVVLSSSEVDQIPMCTIDEFCISRGLAFFS